MNPLPLITFTAHLPGNPKIQSTAADGNKASKNAAVLCSYRPTDGFDKLF